MSGFSAILIGFVLGIVGTIWYLRRQPTRSAQEQAGTEQAADEPAAGRAGSADEELGALLEEVRSLRQDIDILKLNPSIGSAVTSALAHARDDLTYDKSSYAVAVKDAAFRPDYAVLVRAGGLPPDYAVAVRPADRPELERLPKGLPPDYAVLVKPAGFKPDYAVLVKPASFPPDYAVAVKPGPDLGNVVNPVKPRSRG